ncbi:MAG: hypothetical protein HYR95_01665 [Candidatus Colwellbacteria bacterium]|nr:hypothetical protein [Candidatus Colwellbacteria bacterium]
MSEQTSWSNPDDAYAVDNIYHRLSEIRSQDGYEPPFQVVKRRVLDEREGDKSTFEATVWVRIKGEKDLVISTGSGRGPISSLEIALRKALIPHFPSIEKIVGVYCVSHTLPNSVEGLHADTQTILHLKCVETDRRFSVRRVAISEPGACEMILMDVYELWALVETHAVELHS